MLRRWQGVALLLGLVSAAGATAFDNLLTFTLPLRALLAPGHGAGWRFLYVMGLLAAAALWAGMQRAQIEGGPFMDFAASLPFTPRQRRRVDLAVLALADSPLLLLLAGALVAVSRHGVEPAQVPVQVLAQILALADVGLLALVAQLAMLERRFIAWAGVLVAGLVLAAGIGTRLGLPAAALVGAAAGLALHTVPWPRLPPCRLAGVRPSAGPGRWLGTVAGRHAPALRISLGILLRERRDETLAKAAGATVVLAGAAGLMAAFDHDARAFAVALLAQGAVALQFSGLFRGLHMAHLAGSAYTGALPLPARWWRPFDLAAVLGVGLPFLALPGLMAWLHGTPPPAALAATASYALLLCCLRAPQLFNERHAVVLSLVLAGAWAAATIGCLY